MSQSELHPDRDEALDDTNGGAFDPIHNAHLRIAREAVRHSRLDKVLFVPAAHPPHKELQAPYEDRFRMVELALGGEPCFEASRLEAGTAYVRVADIQKKLGDCTRAEASMNRAITSSRPVRGSVTRSATSTCSCA